MTDKNDLPSGFNCATCDKRHAYPGYVFAHFQETLTHTCGCGAQHRIRKGKVTQIKKGKNAAVASGNDSA